jgi:hypothetical protein
MPVVHAPDGGIVCGSLCEEPTGDTTTIENHVSCTECLDILEELPSGTFERLARPTAQLRSVR